MDGGGEEGKWWICLKSLAVWSVVVLPFRFLPPPFPFFTLLLPLPPPRISLDSRCFLVILFFFFAVFLDTRFELDHT